MSPVAVLEPVDLSPERMGRYMDRDVLITAASLGRVLAVDEWFRELAGTWARWL
jgi:hypothetical protein